MTRKSGPSGRHSNPRRQLSQSEHEFWYQDHVAKAQSKNWAEWARAALKSAAEEDASRFYVRAFDPADD